MRSRLRVRRGIIKIGFIESINVEIELLGFAGLYIGVPGKGMQAWQIWCLLKRNSGWADRYGGGGLLDNRGVIRGEALS